MNYTKEIKIKCGLIKGKMVDEDIAAYLGIPYAQPPVGSLRFKEAIEHEPWDGVLECTEYGKSPYQNPITANPLWTEEFMASSTEISEDCLTINVVANTKMTKMPVVLYHFGGGFTSGGSSCEIYDGTTLAKNGVILVTFNHREGTFGLYSSETLSEKADSKASGNYLLLDDIMALKWVRENIEAFGGDKDNITIMGQSSGAAEVNSLVCSPLTKGMYKRAFSLGFNSYNLFARLTVPKELGYEMSKRVLDELNVTEDEFVNLPAEKMHSVGPIGNLSIDGYSLVKDFKSAVLEGDTNDIPIVMSAVPGDSMMASVFSRFLFDGGKLDSKDTLRRLCTNFFKEKEDLAEKIYDFENNDIDTIKKAINEDFTISSMLEFAKGRKIAKASAPTYLLYFTHVMPGPNSKAYGAFHSAEVPYYFNHLSKFRDEYWTEDDYNVAHLASSELVQLAKGEDFISENLIPSDGNNYCLLATDGIKNVVFPEDKRELYAYAFEHTKGTIVVRDKTYSYLEDDFTC